MLVFIFCHAAVGLLTIEIEETTCSRKYNTISITIVVVQAQLVLVAVFNLFPCLPS